jgi:hypothetical protein
MEAMLGCDSCGAQVRRDDRSCPICGAPVARPAARAGGVQIPVRRYGQVPPYPVEFEELLEQDGPGRPRRTRHRLAPYALAALSAVLLAACGYWFR